MNKKVNIAIVAVMLIFIYGSLALNILTPSKAFSDMENRNLAQMPEISGGTLISGKFMSDYESYITDQFYLRDGWVGLKYLAERGLLKTENNGVYFGKNGMLLDKFLEPERRMLDINIKAVGDLEKVTGLPTFFTVAPTSAYIYADSLPNNAQLYDQGKLFGELAEMPQYFDISGALEEHRDEYIYYSTDHHWTTRGAYLAYVAMGEQMGFTPIDMPKNPQTVPDFYGTLLSRAGARFYDGDTIEYYAFENLELTDGAGKVLPLYDMSFADKKDKYSIFLGGNHPLAVLKNKSLPNGKKLLLLKDSFSNCLLPFLAQNYSEIHIVDPRYNKMAMSAYTAQTDIDEILVLMQAANFTTDNSIFLNAK